MYLAWVDIDLLFLAGNHLGPLLGLKALECALVLVELEELLNVEVDLFIVRYLDWTLS